MTDTPKRLAGLRDALAASDAATAERFAHSLKGSGSNIGAPFVEALAAELEERLAVGSFEELGDLVTKLETEIDRVYRALERER